MIHSSADGRPGSRAALEGPVQDGKSTDVCEKKEENKTRVKLRNFQGFKAAKKTGVVVWHDFINGWMNE